MSLAAAQSAFMAQLLDEDAALPTTWGERHSAGMDIYRNGYRARLVDALKETFERTLQWVGEDAFRQAAAHHVILNPPAGWTLDDCAIGFDTTLAELFADDPDVGELGWLELAMHRAFVAADPVPLTPVAFGEATSEFREADWERLQFTLIPGLVSRPVDHDIPALWQALREDKDPPEQLKLLEARALAVWREDLSPVFRLIERHEHDCLIAARDGATFGKLCALLVEKLGEEAGVRLSGEMLGRWLANGWIQSISSPIG